MLLLTAAVEPRVSASAQLPVYRAELCCAVRGANKAVLCQLHENIIVRKIIACEQDEPSERKQRINNNNNNVTITCKAP